MPDPISDTYLNLPTLRASAILAGAGAWDAAPTEHYVSEYDEIVIFFTYTRGGAAGAFELQLQYSPYSADVVGVESWFAMSIYQATALVAGVDTTSNLQREIIQYTAVGAAAEMFMYAVALADGIARIRMPCRESGNVGAPGVVHAVGLLGSKQ